MTSCRNSGKMPPAMPTETAPRTYTGKEVTEILKRAMAQGLRTDGLTHDDLIEMARELDIDESALATACKDVARGKEDEIKKRSEAEELSAERARCFQRFLSSLVTYAVISAGLFFASARFHLFPLEWLFWVLAIWGLVLLVRLRAVISPEASLEKRKRRELRRQQKEQRRLEREQWRARMRHLWTGPPHHEAVEQGAKQFEAAVQNGVAALLNLAARKIEAHLEGKADRTADYEDPRGRGGRRTL
jgi:hypothetical protein